MKKFIYILFLTTLLSCQNFTVVNLLTDSQVVYTYAELYNKNSKRIKIKTTINEDIKKTLELNTNKYDIVIAKNINNKKSLDNFKKISIPNKNNFYPNILKSSMRQNIIPLNIDFDIIAYSKDNFELINNNGLTINLQQIMSQSKEFNKKNRNDDYSKIAFSFLWNENFVFNYLKYANVTWSERRNKLFVNKDKLNTELVKLQKIYKENFDNPKDEQNFKNKYIYDTPYNLLTQKKVLFYYMKLSDFIKIEEKKRSQLSYFIYNEGNKIYLNNNSTFIGLLKKSNKTNSANSFVKWLFNENIQEKLVEHSQKSWINSFGIDDSFSTFYKINETIICDLNREVKSLIPNKNIVYYQSNEIDNWNEIKKEILFPWIIRAIITDKIDEYPENRIITFLKSK